MNANDRHLLVYHSRRRAALEILGGVCSVCGTTDDLEIDHLDSESKSVELNRLWWNEQRYFEELKKCQLLCNFHHLEKTAVDKKSRRKHGTITMYKHGKCRCQPCVESVRQWQRDYRKRNKT